MAKKRLSIEQFAHDYENDSQYNIYNGVERVYEVFHYWAVCGYADLRKEVGELTHTAQKELLQHIVCEKGVTDSTMSARADRKIVINLIDAL